MEEKHPIESLMITSMTSIESMVDVNTIIGESIIAPDGSVIIPLSKVCFGFAAGGSEFNTNKLSKYSENVKLPFGGGSGAGVHISPVGFLVMKDGNARVLNVNGINVIDRAVDMIPDIINKLDGIINKKMDKEAKNVATGSATDMSPDDFE
jgi:sporulation protein YtfJ